MLATTVLLAACVHDTDDFNLIPTESGASLTYYIGLDKSGEDDPWDTIQERFFQESVHTANGKRGDGSSDPWDTIMDRFGRESVHTGSGKYRRGGEGHAHEVDLLAALLGSGADGGAFMEAEKSAAVFVSFDGSEPTGDRAWVVEVRGRLLKVLFADGAEQYVVSAPLTWGVGTELATGFLPTAIEKGQPLMGVRFWRVVHGVAPAGGVNVIPDTVNRKLVWPDPWDQLSEVPFY